MAAWRNIEPVFLLCAASLAFTIGGVCMKYSEGLVRPWPTALLFGLFMAGAGFQAVAMRTSEMGVAYIFVLGLESVLAFLFSVSLFHEPASGTRILAVLLITGGIMLLHR